MREDDFLTLESIRANVSKDAVGEGRIPLRRTKGRTECEEHHPHEAPEERCEDEDRTEKYQKRSDTGADELTDEPHEQPSDATDSTLLEACLLLYESTRTPVTAASQ